MEHGHDGREQTGREREGAGKGFSFEETAKSLGVPKEQWHNPTVERFVNLANRVENLRVDFATADAKQIAGHEEQPAVDPTLEVRYENAEVLLGVVHAVLADGLAGGTPLRDDPLAFLKTNLNDVIRRYGLVAVDAHPTPQDAALLKDTQAWMAEQRHPQDAQKPSHTGSAAAKLTSKGNRA
jgi:hypothetical protein